MKAFVEKYEQNADGKNRYHWGKKAKTLCYGILIRDFLGLSKWLAQAILSGRHRPQCLGSKIKKVRHVVTIQYSAHVVLIYLRTKMFVHLWNAFIQQKYHEPLLTIKTSVMKTESLVHIVECVTCSEQWMRVDLQSSVQLSALWGKSFQRCYHWADILRPSSLWHFINWHPFIADSQLVFPIGFDAHYINQTVHTCWWSDLCLYVFHSWFKYSLQRKTSCCFSDNSWNPVQNLWRWGLYKLDYTIACLWRIQLKQLQHQISILEWFLKDHVTLKTGVMAAENSALPSQK